MTKIVDLSIPLENNPYADPPGFGPSLLYQTHAETAETVMAFFPGLMVEDLPGGEGWAIEQVRLNTHNGTHLDAPYHFHSTMNKGERAMTIDQVPLDWCFRPGVKLDFRRFDDLAVLAGVGLWRGAPAAIDQQADSRHASAMRSAPSAAPPGASHQLSDISELLLGRFTPTG